MEPNFEYPSGDQSVKESGSFLESDHIAVIEDGRPDSLLLTCCSFEEDRCLAALRVMSGYRAECAGVIYFVPPMSLEAEARKQRAFEAQLEILSGLDGRRAPKLFRVGRYDYPSLRQKLGQELRGRGITRTGLVVTIDMSCITRIHLVFLLRLLITEWKCKRLRLLYSVPKAYNTRGSKFKRLAKGVFTPMTFPLVPQRSSKLSDGKRMAIVLLGHEGQRTMSSWRRIEADSTVLIFPNSENPKMRRKCEEENQYLLGLASSGDAGMFIAYSDLNPHAASAVTRASLSKFSVTLGDRISIVPFGPKPILVGVVLELLTRTVATELMYSVPTSYNSYYSVGVQGIHSWEFVGGIERQ